MPAARAPINARGEPSPGLNQYVVIRGGVDEAERRQHGALGKIMAKTATEVMQEVIFSVVLDAIGALKAASKGLPNTLLRDINSIHANTTFADLPPELRPVGPRDLGFQVRVGSSLDDIERTLIYRTIEFAGGNKTRAAEILGVSIKTLYNRLERYQVKEREDNSV